MDKVVEEIRQTIRDVPDFPKPGIIFKDITPLLCHGVLFGKAIDVLASRYEGQKIDAVVGIESRGFIFGAALAYRLGAGFCMVRKPGKLPYETHRASYELEYGSDTLEVHRDALQRGQSAVLVDDLIATGGTAAAATALIEKLGGRVVESAFIIELAFLKARDKLAPHKVFSLIRYDSE